MMMVGKAATCKDEETEVDTLFLLFASDAHCIANDECMI
jgi:hypothetical protein